MAATDNDALLKAMDQLMKEEDRASVIEYAKQLSTKGGDVVGTMRKMSQQGVDTKKEAAMWKKRALVTAAVAVVVCAVMFGLMVAAAEVTREIHVSKLDSAGSGRRLSATGDWQVVNSGNIPGGIRSADYWQQVTVTPQPADPGRQLTDAEKMVDTSMTTMWARTDVDETRRLGAGGQGKQGRVLSAVDYFNSRRLDDDGRELASGMTEFTVHEIGGDSDMTETVCYREHSNGFVEHFIPRCPTPEESDTRRLLAAGNSDGTIYHKRHECTTAPCGHLQDGNL